jgi:hypothetical protein
MLTKTQNGFSYGQLEGKPGTMVINALVSLSHQQRNTKLMNTDSTLLGN